MLVPNKHRAIIEFQLRGWVASDTRGISGPVSISTAGQTRFVATKRIVLDGSGLHLAPAVCRATTETRTQHIDTYLPGLRGNIARNIASRRVAEDRCQINFESARHTEQRISRALDERVAAATRRMYDSFAPVLVAVGRSGDKRLPSRMICRTTASGLHIILSSNPPSASADRAQLTMESDQTGSLASVRIYAPLIKLMLADVKLRDVLKPLARSFKGSPRPLLAGLPPAGSVHREITWAAEHDWVTIRWSATSAQPASKRGLARMKTAATQIDLPAGECAD
jgi:hypothetical protein